MLKVKVFFLNTNIPGRHARRPTILLTAKERSSEVGRSDIDHSGGGEKSRTQRFWL